MSKNVLIIGTESGKNRNSNRIAEEFTRMPKNSLGHKEAYEKGLMV